MANVSITVNVDFTNVTYVPGQGWSGQPAWTVAPANQPMHNGNNKITWLLTTLNANRQNSMPAGYTAAYPATGAITFKPSNQYPWPGSTPTTQADGTVTADDNFRNLGATQNFFYTTAVTLSPNAGSGGAPGNFTFDPDIENQSGSILHVGAAEPAEV